MKPLRPNDPAALRRKAKTRRKAKPAASRPKTEAHLQRLQQELEVRQIDLEMQNEELRRARDEVEAARDRYTNLFEFAPVGYFNLEADGAIRMVNLSGATLLGVERAALPGRRFGQFVAESDRGTFSTFLGRVFATEEAQSCELELASEGRPALNVHLQAAISPEGKECRVLVTDITERKRLEAIIACRTKVLERMATGAPLAETLTALCRLIEGFAPGMLCSILLLDADGKHLRHGAAPSLPAPFMGEIDGKPIGPRAGSCGTAAFRREPVIVEDIASDPLWAEFRAVALPHGLRACWSTPIFDERQGVLGTFAIYYRQPGRPAAHHLALVDLATNLAAIAIGKQRAEETLQRYSTIFQQAGWGMVVADPDTNVLTHVNPTFARMHGYSVDEMRGMNLTDTVTPESLAGLPAQALAAHDKGHHVYESEHLRKDGSRFPCLTDVTAFKAATGRVLFRAATFEDIAERKRAEEALRESEVRFRAIFEQAAVGVAQVALDGRWMDVNLRLCEIVGYTRDELLAITFQDITHPDDLEADLEFVRQMLAGQIRTYGMEKRYRRKDGSIVWIHLSVSLVRSHSGEPEYFISVVQNISERKRGEEILRRLVAGTASVTGDEFFAELVRHLAAALVVRHAFVTQRLPGAKDRLRTLAGWVNDRPGPIWEYSTANTPCEAVIHESRPVCYPDRVQELFPHDKELAEMGAVSYLAVPLLAETGTAFGHVCVLDDKPLAESERALDIVRVFAARGRHRTGAQAGQREIEGALPAVAGGAGGGAPAPVEGIA